MLFLIIFLLVTYQFLEFKPYNHDLIVSLLDEFCLLRMLLGKLLCLVVKGFKLKREKEKQNEDIET